MMIIKEEIKKLINLQEVDTQIYKFSQEKNIDIPAQIEKLKEEFEEEKKKLSFFEDNLKTLQVKRKNKELDLGTKENEIKKAQTQLYQLKTNKEYQIKLSEISTLKADISVLEEVVIKIFDEVENAEKSRNEARAKISLDEKAFKDKEAKLRDRIKEIEGKLNEFQSKRDVLLRDVDKGVLIRYNNILSKCSGLAVVSVENNNCGACHMQVTHQKVNEIKMYNELAFCESCIRILYISEDLSL